ncbi:similar to phage transcriptional regulator, AlpA [Oleispira antarctica RB-8]|jgi:prophage regulatory protein|uniref:Similar to phage transcriptional regulator, AlpA n=1 Tax=Oleispira antarctica RB-8 TaxID=698738 RepID=R4YJU4_OLEAN|nr:similar to phage transcriptional regulator, AlpA [Oleispira antarctica RB-8]
MSERILRRKEVQQLTGLSCSTIYAFMQSDKFPKSINLGSSRMVGWSLSSIENWIETQCAQASSNSIDVGES